MLRSALPLLALLGLLLPGATAGAEGSVQVLREIPFKSAVPKAVREECELQTKVPSFLAEYSSQVKLVDGLGKGRKIEMAITEVHAPGGGAFSGPKWLEVTGTLSENGKKLGSFRAKRFSTGGAFATFKGTCSIIGRTTRAIGQDIATWLEEPTMNAELGDAR
ncbi:MAG: hypothetical protein QNK05_02695 [Myxococcota bacterium]|nr:hypothetical protein [Myxococcota bacterium]